MRPSRRGSHHEGGRAVERDSRQGRAAQAAHVGAGGGRRVGEKVESFNTLIDDLVRPTAEVARTIGAVAKGDLGQSMELEVDGRAAQGRIPALGQTGQRDDRAALGLHLGSHPRGARGRHRGQARRAGAGQRRVGCVEGADRLGQPDGRQSDGAGAQHRRRDHRRGQRRPVQEDHRRCARRNLAAQGGHQHDGGSAPLLRRPK